MGASFILQAGDNGLDGVTANVTISGSPTGAVSFLAARTPDSGGAVVVPSVLASAGVYTVTLPAPVLWYIWGQDSGGLTGPVPVWVSTSNNLDMELCGKKVRDLLEANRAAIEAKIKVHNPDETLKKIAWGSALGIDDFPSIIVVRPKEDPKYAFFAYGSEIDYTVEVFALVLHQDKLSALTLAADMIAACMSILRQPAYSTVTLDSGLPLNVTVNQGTADDEQLDENKWAATGSLVWSGNGLTQDGSLTWP
jgi:hypothetical protein